MNRRPIKHKTRFLISCVAVLTFMLVAGCGSTQTEPATTAGSSSKRVDTSNSVGTESNATIDVQLVLEFNGRTQDQTYSVECNSEATVFDVLQTAANENEFQVDSSGAGETAFIRGINNVENEGASGDNWVYRINGKLGDRGSGVARVQADDKITWRFGAYKLK